MARKLSYVIKGTGVLSVLSHLPVLPATQPMNQVPLLRDEGSGCSEEEDYIENCLKKLCFELNSSFALLFKFFFKHNIFLLDY